MGAILVPAGKLLRPDTEFLCGQDGKVGTSPTRNADGDVGPPMTDVRSQAETLQAELSEHVDVSTEEIAERLETLVGEFQVPIDEAARSVRRHYLDEAGVDPDSVRTTGAGSDEASLASIEEPDEWVDVTVRVVDLWEPRSDAIDQVGLVGDPSGRLKFTKWAKSDLPRLEEGASYRLRNVVTDEYQGSYSIKLNRTTEIEPLEETVEVGDDTMEVTGAFVDVQSGSGLIKRCPHADCTRVLQNGRCAEHGEVDGEFDLRIKGVIDDGATVQEVIFDQAATETVSDISLEEAQQMAMDALDTEIVADEIRDRVLGRYFRIKGPEMGRYVLVDAVEELGPPGDAESVLIRARSI